MKRRQFLTALGGATLAPLAARAQAKVPRIGILLYSRPDAPEVAFRNHLASLGYADGQNVAFDYRIAEGRLERLPGLASELVNAKPDLLFVTGGDIAPHAVKATSTIPIVFVTSNDPARAGLVASLRLPGGNATGVTFLHDEIASKRLELLKEAAPKISQVALLYNPDHVDNEREVAEQAAARLGLRLHPVAARGLDVVSAFQAIEQIGADSIYAVSSRQIAANIPRIVEFATQKRLPLVGGWGAWAQAGGLLSYGPNTGDVVREAAIYVDRILKGAKPADLPVQQPTRFELIVNVRAAKNLGLTIPEAFLLRADRLIE